MNGSVKDWIAKSDGDFDVAQLALRAEHRPNYDAVCFHAQQCLEKLMKAILIHHATVPPRVHDLVALGQLVRAAHPSWTPVARELRFLTQGAILFRYPGESATQAKAEQAMAICHRLRGELLGLLQTPGG